MTWRPIACVSEDKVKNSTQVTKTPLAGDVFCGLPGGGVGWGAAAADARNKLVFVFVRCR